MKRLILLLPFAGLFAAAALAEDEFAIAFRFRVEPEAPATSVAYGLSYKRDPYLAEAPFEFVAKDVTDVLAGKSRPMAVEAECAPGAWHHVAFAYSVSNGWCRLWFDGRQQEEQRLAKGESLDADALLKLKPKPGFPGEVTGVKTFRRLPAMAELFAGDVAGEEAGEVRAAFEKAAAEPGVSAAFADWCRAKAKAAAAFGDDADLGAWHRLLTFRHRLPKLLPLAKTETGAPAVALAIDRYAVTKHVPFAVPADAKPLAALDLRVARDEWDCESFMLHPLADAKDFFFRVTDLRGPDGATIPGTSVDIRVVKAWYQCRGGWNTYFAAGCGMPTLCPELLVHDDAFMRVDTDARRNLLRVSYPEGPAYIDVSERVHEDAVKPFNHNQEPVADAKEFRPLDLEEGAMRQFWLTYHAPDGQRPGVYEGALEMSVGGRPAGRIPLRVTVHPFRLPWPALHCDIDRPMVHGWYHHCSIREKLTGAGNAGGAGVASYDFDRAAMRTDAEFRNMVEHGMGNICCETYGGDTNEWDLADAAAVFLKRNGAVLDPLFGDVGVAWRFALMKPSAAEGVTNASVEANYAFWQREMCDYSNRWERIAPKLREVYGHTHVMCYGFDEAGPETVRREMPFFATADHFGGFTYTSQGRPQHAAFITDHDGCPQSIARETAHSWHASGARLTTYAVPHGGPENPDLWRRRKGLFLWFADFDGQYEYVWYEGRELWNEFVYGPSRQYKNFCMVQPTIDGVIDTIQWEAAREGVDDMRYATLLKRLCRAARETGDAALVKDGREFDAWLELCDYRKADLEGIRAEMVRRIVSLRAALAAKGADVEAFAPPRPVCRDLPLPKPAKMTGDGYARRNMLDYAIPAWLAEGTEEARFKVCDAYLKRRMPKEAAALLAEIESAPDASVGAKARCKLERGFIGLVRLRHDWVPKPEDVAAAQKALDAAVRHDLARIGGERLARKSMQLMQAFSAIGDHEGAAAAGERLATGSLRKFMSAYPTAELSSQRLAVAIGEEYILLGRYKKAMDWFSGPAKAKSLHAMMRYGEAARLQKDYVKAMDMFADAAALCNTPDGKHMYKRLTALVRQMSEQIRRNTKKDVSESTIRNSDADDAIGEIMLDDE